MEYDILVPPIEVDDFSKLKKKEAQIIFNWFFSEIPERLEYLHQLYKAGGGKGDLDYTPDSLISLWEWFLRQIDGLSKHPDEVKQLYGSSDNLFLKDFAGHEKLETLVMSICTDIAIYVGEVFVRNHEQVKWGFVTKPKVMDYANKPALTGFFTAGKPEVCDVVDAVYSCYHTYLRDGKRLKYLDRFYKRWKCWIVK
jgi:hypothetical protein